MPIPCKTTSAEPFVELLPLPAAVAPSRLPRRFALAGKRTEKDMLLGAAVGVKVSNPWAQRSAAMMESTTACMVT